MAEGQRLGAARDIGRCILDHGDAILDQWERRSREANPRAGEEPRENLLDGVPQLVARLGETLASGSAQARLPLAAEHGIQRWRIGWDAASLVRDYMVLRRVLITDLRRSIDLSAEDMIALSAVLDEAVAESVSVYMDHHELDLRQKNEALLLKNYELKRFASVTAHEVRSPMGLITMGVGMLKRSLAQSTQLTPAVAEALELIVAGEVQIVEVVDNLSHYAVRETDAAFRTEPVDLETVYDQVVDRLKHSIQSYGGAVTRGPLPVVRGNASALRAVFQNLIENALKYAGDAPPRVHVSAALEPAPTGEAHEAGQTGQAGPTAAPVEAKPTPPTSPTTSPRPAHGTIWAIAFRDEGIGISPEDQKRIFRFLSRVNIDPKVPGTGVGLALCRRIAEQHGGTIGVQSEPGRGSTFTLRLPVEGDGG